MAMKLRDAVFFAVGVIVGIAAPTAVTSYLDALAASHIRHSISGARAISAALEQYKKDMGEYPPTVNDHGRLSKALTPRYLRAVPKDAYHGKPFIIMRCEGAPVIVSLGRGGFVVKDQQVQQFQPYRPDDKHQVLEQSDETPEQTAPPTR